MSNTNSLFDYPARAMNTITSLARGHRNDSAIARSEITARTTAALTDILDLKRKLERARKRDDITEEKLADLLLELQSLQDRVSNMQLEEQELLVSDADNVVRVSLANTSRRWRNAELASQAETLEEEVRKMRAKIAVSDRRLDGIMIEL
ncbi:hypothetical protein FISHEDRAFT_60623 [Fistulina hepatica ATCC 64428]|uniref:Uncharacterized protein n=1 Tax=Fistulina hepatica ATCC 64428 TaxID=1128425 RepID=A0A0D7A5Y7_9AGAR|nr:hypothetical protein FISHEDRAFT_60623 [Fistulina hepatica ATCC 64428]